MKPTAAVATTRPLSFAFESCLKIFVQPLASWSQLLGLGTTEAAAAAVVEDCLT